MDSKLVVEQMSGRWKIKHPDMRPLAMEANRLAPFGTTYTWVPREQNKHADRLANEALDGKRRRDRGRPRRCSTPDSRVIRGSRAGRSRSPRDARRWTPRGWPTHTLGPGPARRHRRTPPRKRFSGGLASANPGLSDEGRGQVRATADWLAPIADRARSCRLARCAAPSSPPRSSPRRSAGRGGGAGVRGDGVRPLGRLTMRRWPSGTRPSSSLARPLDVRPAGGESFRQVEERVPPRPGPAARGASRADRRRGLAT